MRPIAVASTSAAAASSKRPDVGEHVGQKRGDRGALRARLGQQSEGLAQVRDRELEVPPGEGDPVAEADQGPRLPFHLTREPAQRRRFGEPALGPHRLRGFAAPRLDAADRGQRPGPRPGLVGIGRVEDRRRQALHLVPGLDRRPGRDELGLDLPALAGVGRELERPAEELGAVGEVDVALGHPRDTHQGPGVVGQGVVRRHRQDRAQLGELELAQLLPAARGEQLGHPAGVADLVQQGEPRGQLAVVGVGGRRPARVRGRELGLGRELLADRVGKLEPARAVGAQRQARVGELLERPVARARGRHLGREQRQVREAGEALPRLGLDPGEQAVEQGGDRP